MFLEGESLTLIMLKSFLDKSYLVKLTFSFVIHIVSMRYTARENLGKEIKTKIFEVQYMHGSRYNQTIKINKSQ